MKRLSFLLSVLLAATMTPLLTLTGADAARTAAPVAKNDAITITAGRTVTIAVKANDTAYRKRRAKVRVVRSTFATTQSARASVRGGRTIRLSIPESMEPGTYSVRYRLTDVRGRRDTARVTVKVKPPREPELPEDPTDPGDPVDPPTSDLPLLDVVAAQDLTNRVGIRDFPHYDTSTYGKRAAIEASLDDLGVEWVTLKYVPARDEIADIERLHAMGIKTILTVGETKGGYQPETEAFWKGLTENLVRWGADVPMVSGWNEPNHIRGGGSPLPSDWPLRTLRDNLVPLDKAVAAAHARMTHRVEVGLPALWSGDISQFLDDAEKLAAVRFTDGTGKVWSAHNTVDAITYHLYPRGGDPTWELDQTITALRGTFPQAGPTPWCTEAGYFTAANYRGGSMAVTEAQQAAYVAKMGLEYYLRDGYVSYFETVDDVDPADSNREANLGLVNTPSLDPATWQRKPAFAALAGMLQRKGGTATTVHAEIVAPAGVQRLATVDDQGDVVLYLWRRVNVDANGYAAPVEVTVTTPSGTRTVSVGGRVTAVPLDG
ncbi:MAG: Ig-like domain-containing protein [Nocardioides sp.]